MGVRRVAATLAAVFSRRRVRYTAAAVVIAVAAGAVAVANAALLEVAGSPQNQVGELSAKLDLKVPRVAAATPATTTPPLRQSDADDATGAPGHGPGPADGPRHDGGHRDD